MLTILCKRLRRRQSDGKVFRLEHEDGIPCIGVIDDRDAVRELQGICLQLEPLLRMMGADIRQQGKTADGRVLEWVSRTLQCVEERDFVELPDNPFRSIDLAIETLLASQSVAGTKQAGNKHASPHGNGRKANKIDLAIAVKQRHPEWTHRQIAEAVPCSENYLSQSKRYKDFCGIAKSLGQESLRRSRRHRGREMDRYGDEDES